MDDFLFEIIAFVVFTVGLTLFSSANTKAQKRKLAAENALREHEIQTLSEEETLVRKKIKVEESRQYSARVENLNRYPVEDKVYHVENNAYHVEPNDDLGQHGATIENNDVEDFDLRKAIIYRTILERKY